jgi:hypothetical protein
VCNLLKNDVVSVFRGSLELWPSLVEIACLQKRRVGWPAVLVPKRERAELPTVH